MHIYTYTCRRHIDAIIKTSEDFFKKAIPLTLFKRLCVWEGVGDRTELQHIDPHSYGYQCFFPVLLMLLNRRTGGPLCWVLASSTSSCHQWVWSPKTNWLPVFTELYNSSIAHSVSPHNWPSACVTSVVFGMACLIVIKQK